MRIIFTILFSFIFCFGFSQSISAPVGRTYQINTSGQDASGFIVNGFTSETLLTSVGLVNPPAGVTFSITTTAGLSFATGYNSWSNITRISFTGTQSNINNALASLKINTGSSTGNVVTFTAPKPVYSDYSGTTDLQCNAVALGGFNGLNN